MKIFIGKNTDFKVVWDFHKQTYFIYKNNKYIGKTYFFRDANNYLN